MIGDRSAKADRLVSDNPAFMDLQPLVFRAVMFHPALFLRYVDRTHDGCPSYRAPIHSEEP